MGLGQNMVGVESMLVCWLYLEGMGDGLVHWIPVVLGCLCVVVQPKFSSQPVVDEYPGFGCCLGHCSLTLGVPVPP